MFTFRAPVSRAFKKTETIVVTSVHNLKLHVQWNLTFEATPFLRKNVVGRLRFMSHRLRGHLETAPPFTVPCGGCGKMWPFRGENHNIYVQIYIVKWPFQRGWSLFKVASQKGFHCSHSL